MTQKKIIRYIIGALLLLSIGIIPFSISSRNANAAANATIPLPSDRQSYKIEVSQDGIHEVDYAALQAAGMNVGSVNPQTFQLIHRGESVAFQFLGDADTNFEAGEKIRFYGWEFDGTRYEQRYIDNTLFWLWADGTPDNIASESNAKGNPVATQWRSSVTNEVDRAFSPSYFRWRNEPNEPDSFYWDYIYASSSTATDFEVILPHPVANAADADLTAEFISSWYSVSTRNVNVAFNLEAPVVGSWLGKDNVNINDSLPSSALNQSATNNVSISVDSGGSEAANDFVMLNRITVDYWRQFEADDDQLIFNSHEASTRDFEVRGLNESNAASIFVWDITDRNQPVSIDIATADVNGGNVHFGRNNAAANSTFIVTTEANIRTPVAISAYTPIDITPADGAEWLAISHADFLSEVNRLADYRENSAGMTSHVVDAHHIYQQYDWGYWSPIALRNYVQEAYDTWPERPAYLLLVGDATHNPRQLECDTCSSSWDTSIDTLLPTDLIFEDRFLGMIPSDHTFALLEGNDLVPDISVGRIAARNLVDVTNVVDKTLRYEDAIQKQESWLKEMIFLADNTDGGGNFCYENSNIESNFVPDIYNSTHLCLPTDSSSDIQDLRTQFFGRIASHSGGIINYRGHGGIAFWGGSLVTRDDTALWANNDKPSIILSADCLDSHFAWVESAQSLSESFLMMESAGSVAHWGSTGLGYSAEHSILHGGFYDAQFNGGANRIGDAIKQSKSAYITGSAGDISEAYTFTLQGDPALRLDVPLKEVFLPIVIK